MDLQKADFGLFQSLVEKVTWEAILKGKGMQEDWTFFREKT